LNFKNGGKMKKGVVNRWKIFLFFYLHSFNWHNPKLNNGKKVNSGESKKSRKQMHEMQTTEQYKKSSKNRSNFRAEHFNKA